MIEKYQRQRELKLRKEEEKKAKSRAKAQEQLRAELKRQAEDKKVRAAAEKADRDQQADMWKKENELWKVEEARVKAKVAKVNQDTKAFLESQVAQKQVKAKKKMDDREAELNKGLMREIRAKKLALEAEMAADSASKAKKNDSDEE